MRVLILSQYYKPEPIPKPSELAEYLRDKGHAVSVVTGFPNYPSGILYPGFKLSLVGREILDGIPIARTYEFPYHGMNSLGRVLNYLSFMITAPLGSLFLPKCDVMYVWHPPLTIGVAAWLIARIRGIPFVYDVQDIWPESIVLSGMIKSRLVIRILSMFERFVYSQADHILVVTNGARDNLLEKGVSSDKVSVMPHWVDETKSAQIDAGARRRIRQEYGWTHKFVSVFAGNIGVVQGLETLIHTAALLPRDSGFLICLIGSGADRERLQELANSLDVHDRLQFIDRLPAEEMPAVMEASDAVLVHLKNAPLADWVIPTKVFAYLSAGKPILMAMGGAAAEMVKDSGSGIVIPAEDAAALSQGIRSLSDLSPESRASMGQRGQEYLAANFSKPMVLSQYEDKLQMLAKRTTGPMNHAGAR